MNGSDYCIGSKNFIGLCYATKKSSKSPIENTLILLQHTPIITSTSLWLDSSIAERVSMDCPQQFSIVAATADQQTGSISVVISDGEESFWIKLDSSGRELLRRKLSNSPKYVFTWGGIIWFFDKSCVLKRWNNRFGNELEPVELPAGAEGVPCIIAAGVDGQGMHLLIVCSTSKSGPSHIMRKDLGHMYSLNKTSILNVIGIDGNKDGVEKDASTVDNGVCSSMDPVHKKDVDEFKEKFFKRTLEDLQDESQSSKRRKKIHKNMSSIASVSYFNLGVSFYGNN